MTVCCITGTVKLFYVGRYIINTALSVTVFNIEKYCYVKVFKIIVTIFTIQIFFLNFQLTIFYSFPVSISLTIIIITYVFIPTINTGTRQK